MIIAFILSTLLLTGFLFWCKIYLFKTPTPVGEKPELNRYYDLMLIFIISFTLVGTKYLIDYAFGAAIWSNVQKPVYLNADEQFKIGQAFYLGKELPKDNSQALHWFILAAQQGNKQAQELIRLLGVEIDKNPTENQYESQSNLAVDILPANKIKTKFDDVAGLNQPKQELKNFLEIIKDPAKFKRLGAVPPKGVMLYGPAGNGKTLLARAVAGEANLTFISVSGSAFEEAYIGTGAARIRELFELARKYKPAIVFIDEIDALAPSRESEQITASHIQTINQLLAEMQNVDDEKNAGIYILAATNRLEAMDQALLRPGRFDWQINVPFPTDEDRKQIITKMMKKVKFAKEINENDLVDKTVGFSSADLVNVVNEAAIFAAIHNKNEVDTDALNAAFQKITAYQHDLSPTLGATILNPNEVKTRFGDIAGMNEAKQEVTEIVDFLKDPKSFTRLGAKAPKGILIYGPPGTGKTLMARAIAGESNASFISISGADFEDKYVGVGAQRVRELFKLARKYKPCIIFIDEIDALLHSRNQENEWLNQSVNQFLSEMDNIQSHLNEGIIIIGATNRLESIDPAALRPGRFDRKVFFRLPKLQERAEILQLYVKQIKASPDIDVNLLAKITVGYSGADLANLVNEAAIEATRKNKETVDMAAFEEANDKISLGVKQGNGTVSLEERKRTAYHEAGHALVGLLHPDQPRTLHKMTIGLRGFTLGVTHFRLENEQYSYTKKEFEAMISTALGGYIAEEIIFGRDNVSAGAASDLVNANKIARDMVANYAMGDTLSLLSAEVFPEEVSSVISGAEIILKRDYDQAKSILQKNKDKLDLLANALLEKETLDYNQIVTLLKIKP